MAAFIISLIVGFLILLPIPFFAGRRAPYARLTWAEAMVAATYVFGIMVLWYGVIPNQWLLLADNEWNWRPDRMLFGPGNIVQPQAAGGWLPLTISYLHLRDVIAVLIYVVGLGGHIALWSYWQNRGDAAKKKEAAKADERSTFGRPLVKEGANA